MAKKEGQIAQLCEDARRQVRECFKDLDMRFILHETGQFEEACTLYAQELQEHPAFAPAEIILNKSKTLKGESGLRFLGLALSKTSAMLGLGNKDNIIGLAGLNIDHCDNLKDARRLIYHLAWHGIDVAMLRENPLYKGQIKPGPIVPKRSPMNLAKANLQADVFAACMAGFMGEKNAVESLAWTRAMNCLCAQSGHRPEDYPYPIAMEATQFAFEEVTHSSMPKKGLSSLAYNISLNVGSTVDESNIRQWWAFSEQAQHMAWNGCNKKQILGAAINTSEDPYIRSIGYLMAEITKIDPSPSIELGGLYNPYADSNRNKRLHNERMNEQFEEAISLGVEQESAEPFLEAANEQNMALTNGHIIGWCAYALQAAAKAFEIALANGQHPTQAARLEFEGSKQLTTWDAIKALGEAVLSHQRAGYAVTMGHIADISSKRQEFDCILESVKRTMQEPEYIKKLAPANDLSLTADPQAPAPAPAPALSPSPAAPSHKNDLALQSPPSAAPCGPAPAPGGGGGSSASLHQRRMHNHLQQKKALADGKNTAGKNTGDHSSEEES